MSLLTDIFIASPAEAEAISDDAKRSQRWPCLQFNGVDSLMLADLLDALGADADGKALRGDDRMIYMKDRNGPWVFHLPDTLPTLLAKLEDEQLPEVVERWVQGEELSFAYAFQARLKRPVEVQAQIDETQGALKKLRDFARQAVGANKPLLLWMCR